MFKMIALIKR